MGERLTRRQFDKLSAATMAMVALSACGLLPKPKPDIPSPTPSPTPQKDALISVDQALIDADMAELIGFYHVVADLQSTFGPKILDKSFANCARDFFGACNAIVSKPLSYDKSQVEPFTAKKWGIHKEQVLDASSEHLDQAISSGIDIPSVDTQVAPYYVPPTQQEVAHLLKKYQDAFPLLSLTAAKYIILRSKEGGSFTSGTNMIKLPDPVNNSDMFYLVLFHESMHGAETNYLALQQFMTLADYSVIPTELMKNCANVAREWFSLAGTHRDFTDYGFIVHLYDEEPKSSLVERCIQLFGLQASLPIEMQISDIDAESAKKYKMEQQLNYIIHHLGNALLKKDRSILDSEEKLNLAHTAMSYFFGELTHYFVGPYQLNGGLPDSYVRLGKSGIGVHNLAMHKARVQTFLADRLKTLDPSEVRTALGLERSTDLLIKYGAFLQSSYVRPDGKYIDIYNLPPSDNYDVVYLDEKDEHAHGSILFIPKDYTEKEPPSDIDISQLYKVNLTEGRNIFLVKGDEQLSVLKGSKVKEERIPWGYHLLNQALDEEEISRSGLKKIGTFNTNKISVSLRGLPVDTQDFIWIADLNSVNPPNIRIYKKPDGFHNAQNAVSFPEFVPSWYFNKTPIIVSDGKVFHTLEQIMSTATPANPGLPIVDLTRENTIRIGDDYNSLFDIRFSTDAYYKIVEFIKGHPESLASFYFEVDYGKDQTDDLKITLKLYADRKTLDTQALRFPVEHVKLVEAGEY